MMERNTLKFLRHFLLTALFLCVLVSAFAIDELDRIYPISLNSNGTPQPPFVDAPFNQYYDPNSLSITNSISLKLNENLSNYINYAFTVKITYDLSFTDLNNQVTQLPGKSVSISYNPGSATRYDAESYFVFRNAKSVTVTVTNIAISSHQADVMTYLIFTDRFHSRRDYTFNYNLSPAISAVVPSGVTSTWQTPDELNVAWQAPNIGNGSDIDVEWAWINTGDPVVAAYYQTNGTYDQSKVFTDNATRVTVPYNYIDAKNLAFKIPLLYESGGTVFFRVRFAQLKNDGTRIEGVWNTSAQLGASLWQFGFNNDRAQYKLNGHMPEMNWQATTSFAEEGKRKTVISYFDGTLRTRQTVTKDNSIEQIDPTTGSLASNPTTVVAETMYDYQGRPVIQVLPAPTIGNLVEYTHHFNVFASYEAQYPKEVYDILAPGETLCQKAAPPLSPQSVSTTGMSTGAANYYSPNNPWKNTDVMGRYIPDAKGFPFTETRYTTDGTGRVEAQGGVGEAHRLGTGHETKYYYSQADQTELDGLFGTDVGDASHYFKSVVKDANGQYSVSYTDMYGKTIATALAGGSPANLTALPSLNNPATGSHQQLTKSLLGSNVVKGSKIESTSSIFLTEPGNAVFNYSLDPQNLKLNLANCNNQNICYDCKYNLEITVSNSCGGTYSLNGSGQQVNLPYTFTSPVFDLSGLNATDCSSTNPIVPANFTLGLREGEYTVTKSLKLNTAARDWYLNNRALLPASQGGNICKSQVDIANDFLTIINNSSTICRPDCSSCLAALGTREGYINNTIAASGFQLTANQSNLQERIKLQAQIGAAWDTKQQNCAQLCNNSTTPLTEPDELATIRQQMLADMTPPGGQYARLNETLQNNRLYGTGPTTGQPTPPLDYTAFPFNIFNIDNGNSMPAYRWPSLDGTAKAFYLDIDGSTDQAIQPNKKDPYAKLDGISAEGFTSLFKDSWAKSLLYYHPEYYKLQYAEQYLTAVYRFNTDLFNVDALFDNGNNVVNDWADNAAPGSISSFQIVMEDPFTNVDGSYFANNMTDRINNYQFLQGYTLTMWEAAARLVVCPDQLMSNNSCTTIRDGNDLKNSGLCTADKNKIWQAFRSLYTSERKKMIYESMYGMENYDFSSNPNNYTERFINFYALQAQYQPQDPNDPNDPNSQAKTQLYIAAQTQAHYLSIAQSYVPKWASELTTCETIGNISNISGDRDNFIKSITDELVKICVAGSDGDHPIGSSSCINYSTIAGNSYLSFEDAIRAKLSGAPTYLTTTNYTTTCNPYIIDWPKPYNFPVAFSNQTIDSKDQCVCDRITALMQEKNGRGFGATPLSTYLYSYYQVTVAQADLDRLTAVCNGTATCNTISPAISLPPLLQCSYHYQSSCVDCATLQGYVAAFKDEFSNRDTSFGPFADPANSLYSDGQVAQHLAANRFYAQYLNKKTGFSKSYDEYALFLHQCDNNGQVSGTSGSTTNTTSSSRGSESAPASSRPSVSGPLLCNSASAIPPTFTIDQPTCDQQHATLAAALAEERYTLELSQVKGDFENAYNQKCLSAINLESFTVTQSVSEYHYTLYYYDQAGNLVQTVPPAGVAARYSDATFLANVRASRASGTLIPNQNHTLATRYLYNSLNQVVVQHTPDAGISQFFYDALGRLVASQNAEQAASGHNNYSYTQYDILGRIQEVGQKNTATSINNSISKDINPQAGLPNWLASGHNTQITRTMYDQPFGPLCTIGSGLNILCQQNLRNRVSYTQVLDDQDQASNVPPYRAATFYSYDIHGNVDILLQDYAVGAMASSGNEFKKITYGYDLISGKVNQVAYQPGYADAFYHHYSYDAENRLTAVQTSRDQVLWQNDAQYFYYRHGPLARTQLGQLHVQGVDYAYTLQGWLKAINPGSVTKTGGNCPPDMGGNGVLQAAPDILHLYDRAQQPPTPTVPIPRYIARQQVIFEPTFASLPSDNFEVFVDPNATMAGGYCNADPTAVDLFDDDGTNNKLFARDAHKLTLNYYDEGPHSFTDYTPIGATGYTVGIDPNLGNDKHNLYNGNIGSMAVNIRKLAAQANATGAPYAGPMLYNYRYDQLNRIASMDAWSADGNFGNLIKLAGGAYAEQYSYDPNGNILTLNRNGANTIGKPLAMDQLAYSYKPGTNQLDHVDDQVPATNYTEDIDAQASGNYQYDAIGNMVHDEAGNINTVAWTVYGKIASIAKKDGTAVAYTYDASGNRISKAANGLQTWYVRDATGNVMATYTKGDATINSGNLTQAEVDLYGSSRLGLLNCAVNCDGGPAALVGSWDATSTRGQKLFELTNHLGNVLATVTDRLVPVPDAGGTVIDYNLPDVASASDYYPFGMVTPGRSFSAGSQYRYGFNGKENDRDINGGAQDYGIRINDTRLGRFLSFDPLSGKYPELTPYQFASNRPIDGIDLDGLEYLQNTKSVYLLHEFPKATADYTLNSLNVTDQAIHKILLDHPDESLKGKDGRSLQKENDEQSTSTAAPNMTTPKRASSGKSQAFSKTEVAQLNKENISNVVSEVEDLYTWARTTLYNHANKEQIDRASLSLAALDKADEVVRAAGDNPSFPKQINNATFKLDLVNFITDGTKPATNSIQNSSYRNLVSTWGLLLYGNDKAIINGSFNFSVKTTYKIITHPLGDMKNPVSIQETSSSTNPAVKQANEILPRSSTEKPATISNANN